MNNLLDLNRLDCESNGISGEMREGGEGGQRTSCKGVWGIVC